MAGEREKFSQKFIKKYMKEEIEKTVEEEVQKRFIEIEKQLNKVKEEIPVQITNTINEHQFDERMIQAEKNLRSINQYIETKEDTNRDDSAIDYFDFENYFRGPREMIKEWQKVYLPYFEGHKNVLDIGCGRGEFLELMTEHGIDATGIDLYDKFVDYCKSLGLKVVLSDGIAYLGAQEQVGGIFASQVIEHLPSDKMIEFCRLAYQKLEKGAYLILETPNPMCLSIFTHAFYIDPSHNKPVHPLTVKYILERAGYSEIKIIYPEVSKYPEQIPMLKGDGIENIDEFNAAIVKLNDVLYGHQDYAIIAKK